MKYIPYHEIPRADWDRLVETSPDGWLYQTSGYVDWAIQEGNKSVSFGVYTDTNDLKAVVPLYLSSTTAFRAGKLSRYFHKASGRLTRAAGVDSPLGLRKLITGYSGPVLAADLGNKGRKKMWREIMANIDHIAAKNRVDTLEMRLTDVAPGNMPPRRPEANPLWSAGIYEQLSAPPRLFAAIDLSKAEAELQAGMDGDCRNEIVHAKKHGILCRAGSCADIGLYHSIHVANWKRTNANPHGIAHFSDMARQLGNDAHLKFFFAENGAVPVAAIMLYVFKDSVFYYGGCSLPEAMKLKANNLLLFSSVLWAKQAGYKWFGVGLFECSPGRDSKEYSVGKYKTQFTKTYFEAYEGVKYYTAAGIREGEERRRALLPKQKR
jgi:hypothetical protein